MTDTWINAASIESSADGQVLYLISDRESDTSTLIHVSPDDIITEVLEMDNDALGVYGHPRWDVDAERGNVVFTTYLDGDYAKPTTIMLMNLNTGAQTELMGGVNEYDFGRIQEHIWWGSNVVEGSPEADYGFYLYDPATQKTTVISVPALMPDLFAFSARLVRALPDGDVLFTVSRMDSDSVITAYYRGDVQTGTATLLHEQIIPDSEAGFPDAVAVFDDRIAYMTPEGAYVEIDFDGHTLHTQDLGQLGMYRGLYATPTGVVFTKIDDEDMTIRGLYHVSRSGLSSELLPRDKGFPFDVRVIATPDGTNTLWFQVRRINGDGELYAYALPTDEDTVIGEPKLVLEGVNEYHTSPDGTYIVANADGRALLINTTSFEQTQTDTDYAALAVFFDEEQPHILDLGRIHFVDTEQDIVYFTKTILPMNDTDEYALYASTYDGSDVVRISPPDMNIAFDLHSRTIIQAADGSILYVRDDWQALYRASCRLSV